MVAWLVSLSFVNKAYTPFPSKPPRRSCPSYKKGGTEELLKSTVHERARQELVTPEALEDLKQTMKMGQIATIGQADEFLREPHGIEYAHRDGVGQLLRGHKIKLKTAPPRHEEADYEEQDAFKKTSRPTSRR
jgi:transposase